MNLTKKEKQKIFWSLMNSYSDFERGRRQAKMFFKGENLKEKIESINKDEKKSYDLLKKFADEIGQKIPEYNSNFDEYFKK